MSPKERWGREGRGKLASGRLIFRAINAPVLVLSLLSKRTRGRDDTSDLLQVPDDGYEIDLCGQRWGHLFHSRDPARTVYMCLPPKMPCKNIPSVTSVSHFSFRVIATTRCVPFLPSLLNKGDREITVSIYQIIINITYMSV